MEEQAEQERSRRKIGCRAAADCGGHSRPAGRVFALTRETERVVREGIEKKFNDNQLKLARTIGDNLHRRLNQLADDLLLLSSLLDAGDWKGIPVRKPRPFLMDGAFCFDGDLILCPGREISPQLQPGAEWSDPAPFWRSCPNNTG